MKTCCIIIDNNTGVLKLLQLYISKTDSLELKGQFNNGTVALDFLKGQPVDIIFTELDIPGITIEQLVVMLPPEQKIIFITGSGMRALCNFPYPTSNYLLKPLSYISFIQAVEKIDTGLKQSAFIPAKTNHLFVRSGSQTVRIRFEDILYIKGEKEYISLHFKDERLLIYKRMKEMENLLPSNFMRVHLSYIINTDHIVKVVANKFLFLGLNKIPIGSSYRAGIKEHIGLRAF